MSRQSINLLQTNAAQRPQNKRNAAKALLETEKTRQIHMYEVLGIDEDIS